MRLLLCAAALSFGVLLAQPGHAAPVNEANFQASTTGDLVALCSADRSDPYFTAAVNFCHGFAVGTYRTLAEVQAGMRSKKKMFCLPNPPPSRDQGIAAFVTWAQGHAESMSLPAMDGVAQFLEQQFPCK